ncbi:fibrous sheath-interacting protein 2 [Thomomys bottae]
MELYLSACSKAANVAANKTATSTTAKDSQQCGELFRPSYDFNLTDPYCRLLETQYKSLHDPHLREYHKRKDILRRLKKGGYITSNNKIVCTLRELNKYRQYLTSLKLDFEKNYLREQAMIAKQLHKLQQRNEMDVTQFQNWLLQEGTQSVKDQERLIRHRYLDMISKELEQLERTAEERRLLRLDREERRQREYTRRKLNLRRKIEEEWKTKEMLLLTKIGEDVKREQRVEEQRRKSREESDKKKQAMIEKKMAYHLQKMQDTGLKDDTGKNTLEHRGQDGPAFEFSTKKKKRSDEVKVAGDQKASKELNGHIGNSIHHIQSMSRSVAKISTASVDAQNISSEQKKNGSNNKKTSSAEDKGAMNISNPDSNVSNQNSPTRNYYKHSDLLWSPPKHEKEANGDVNGNGRRSKKSSYVGDTGIHPQNTGSRVVSSSVFTHLPQNLLQSCLQEKVSSEELNSIIHNIMTWVVATVTSILYPAITKYEERLKHSRYPVSDDSDLSSDSSSFCSTCSEEFMYRRFTSSVFKPFHPEPCTFDGDMSVKRPTRSSKLPSTQVEKIMMEKTEQSQRLVEKTEQNERQSIASQVTYNRASIVYPIPKLRTSKSDSHLFIPLDTGTKTSKDATTETENFETSVICHGKAKATNEMKNLKNVFVNFKCHLKGETQMILESIFQELMSDLTQALPSLSSVTAEVFVDPEETDKEDVLSNVDVCSIASEIVENMLEKLETAVEKKCFQIFSQEDLSVNIETSSSTTGEYFTSISGKPSAESLSFNVEPMRDIAEDMVHAILEKLLAIASYKKSESLQEDTTKFAYQQQRVDSTYKDHSKAIKKKSSSEPDVEANLMVKEEIQNLISNIFSRPSLVGYIEEAISTILGYVQTELNNDRLIASEETVVLLQLLDEILTQLHQDPEKAGICQRQRQGRQRYTDTEEKYRRTSSTLSSTTKPRKRLPLVNVPGMVLYSDDENEEIDNMVKNVLESSFNEEKASSQEPVPNPWYIKESNSVEYMKKRKPSSKTASEGKYAFPEWDSDEDILKEKPFLKKDNSLFSQDQKHQIVKTSGNLVKCILTDMLKDISCVTPDHVENKFSKKVSVFDSEESQGLPHQESTEQMVSMSEINDVAGEIIDSVLNILHKSLVYTSPTSKSTNPSSAHPTFLDSCDIFHEVKEIPNKQPLNIWFDSEKKMKYLSSVNADSSKPSWLRSEENEPQYVGGITENIINVIFNKLKSFVCQKLQLDTKPSSTEKSSFKSQLITYTTKIVNIVLNAIQNEVESSKVNHAKPLASKGIFADSDKKLEAQETNLSDDTTTSPLLSWIWEMLSSENEDQRGAPFSLHITASETSSGFDDDKQNILHSTQDKKAFHQYLAKPCILHSIINEKDPKENTNLQVLDTIGETLHEMLSKLMDTHPDSQAPCGQQDREKKHKDHQTTAALQSNVQLISKTILEYIITKLCSIDTNATVPSSECKAASEPLDIDNLSLGSIINEMAKCTSIISGILSKMVKKDSKEVIKSKVKNVTVVEATASVSKELHQNKLKFVASDILSTVFAKLEGFTSGNLETHNTTPDDKKKGSKTNSESAHNNSMKATPEELLQHSLYAHSKKISSAILKSIQTELNENSPDLSTGVNNPLETQTFMNIVNLILDAVSSSDVHNETENRGTGYQPVYGNFLPGGAESDSFFEDDPHTEEEGTGERTALREETKTDSPQQQVLKRTLNKIEVKFKKQHKSPIVPIIRNILNEIFQNTLISQLNELSFSHSRLSAMPHSVQEPTAKASVPFVDELLSPLVSDTDVHIVANDVVKTVFHKLCSAAILERNISKRRREAITFSANVSFHEHRYRKSSSVTMLNNNPCTLEPRFNVDRQTSRNVGEDIVKAIITNLESFATSKVNSLFFPQVNFSVPVTLLTHQDKSALSKALSDKDSYSNEQFPCCFMDHEKSNLFCQLSLSKLNIYATQVAKKILQGIKHELDKERENPSLDQSVVVSENIASQVVNTVLDFVSCQSKCATPISDKENDSYLQKKVTGKLLDNTEYRKTLCFQMQDTTECTLYNICEKIHTQSNVSSVTPTLKCSTAFKQEGGNSELLMEGENKCIPTFSVPKSDVILLSDDIVDSVLQHLSSAITVIINTKLPDAPRLTFCGLLPKTEDPPSLSMELKDEEKGEHSLYSRRKETAFSDYNQIATEEKNCTKGSVVDPYEENANIITEAIFNHLQSFAAKRIGLLTTPVMLPKEKSFVSLELKSFKQDDSIFHESSQIESAINMQKIPATKSLLKQGLSESTFASNKEMPATTIHLSQAHLMDHANILARAILKRIKSDFDFKIQNMNQYPDSILFQENIMVSETIGNILNILCNRRSTKEMSLLSKENLHFLPLSASNEIVLGHSEKDKTSTMPVFNCPLHLTQKTVELDSQKIVLEEIFMRKKESRQKEKTELLSAIKQILCILDQRAMEVMGCLPALNETSHISPNSKIKTSDTIQKHSVQAHVSNVARDIVESVLGEVYSLVMTTVYKNATITGELEIPEDHDMSPVTHTGFRENKEAKRSKCPRYGIPQTQADSNSDSLLEDPFLQNLPVQVGKDVVQMVSNKITNFISWHVEETFSPEACSNDLQFVRAHTLKVSPKGSPKLGFKTNLKAKAKVTSLSKFKTKTHTGPSGGKVKTKMKLASREKTLTDGECKAAPGPPPILTTGDSQHLLKTKLPTLELIMYAKDIISVILETILKELEKVTEIRAMAKMQTLPSDQITEASKIINTVLQELYWTSNHSLAYPIKLSSLDALKCSQNTRSSAKEQACFYLENVSSQLEQIFPKEGILKKMFDRWQMETNDMENEKVKLLIIAENILKKISTTAKDLESALSILHLPVLEDCTSRLHNQVKDCSTRVEDMEVQINKFGKEIVEMLFEKLQLCFLSQMSSQESKETLTNRQEHLTAKGKREFPHMQSPSSLPICSIKSSGNQIVEEIVESVLNMLESFVDLQFKQISKYEFSDIVRMPIENLSQIQQRLLGKKQLPKLQPLKKLSDVSNSSNICKESIQNTLLEVHSFHSDLLTYSVDIVRDMLSMIKNKLDKEITQMEPSSVSILKENTVASEIIGTLIEQCINFHKALIKNLPTKSFFPRNENVYIVNQIEFASKMKKPSSRPNTVSLGNNPAARNGSGFVFNSEEDAEKKYGLSSSSHSYYSSYIPETVQSSGSMERHNSKTMASCLTNKLQHYHLRNTDFGHSDAAINALPEGSVLQKLFKKVNDSTDEALRQAMSFIDIEKGGNPKVFHYETLKPMVEANEIQTTVSPLRICLAAENIVNTVLSSSGFPYQHCTDKSMESMKPYFMSRGGKKEEKNFHRLWYQPFSCIPGEESNYPEALRKDCSLLQKWQKKNPSIKIKTLKEVEVIGFADHELGPNEIHLVARHVTTSVVTYLKNFKTKVSTEEKISIVSTLSRKKYESTHPLRSIYSDSSIYQFCESLTESVICNLISSISDGTKESIEKNNAWEIQAAAFNIIVSIHSQVFETRSICVGELALSIAQIITDILSNGNIIEADNAQQMLSIKTKYIYCPGVTSSDFDDLFQDLLAGVIHIMSKEIGTNHHFGNSARNKSFSVLRSNNMSICNKNNATDGQAGSKERESYTYQIDQLVQKNKLNYLAHRLDSLIGSLKTPESKEIVNKVFDIVLDLFLPDEKPDRDMDSDKIAKSCFSSSSIQSNRILKNNLGLSPKSVFLLNIVCEKLIRTLLERYTGTFSLENASSEASAEGQLLKILQSMEDIDFDYLRSSMDCEQFQGDMSDLLENMAEIDQDLLSSDCILTFISHSLVKSLMAKLSSSLVQTPKSPCFENKYLNYQTREIQTKRSDFIELGHVRVPFEIMSCDSNPSARSLNSSLVSSKIKIPSGKKGAVKHFVSRFSKHETKGMDIMPTPHKLCQRGINTGIHSATFLEEIISQLFFKLSTSLWRKNRSITEARLNKVNKLFVNSVVNELNNASISVLRNAEEKLCFPPVHKQIISSIVDSVYCNVLHLYQLEATYSNNLTYTNTSVAEQIANSILLEIFDYQLPSSIRRKFGPCSFYPLNAEIILQKLQSNLSKFTFQLGSSEDYSTMLPYSFIEDVIRKLLSQLLPPSIMSSLEEKYLQHLDFNEMSSYIINKVMSAISKHKICLTVYDNDNLYTRKNLQKMVDSVYWNILQMSDSLASVQKSIVSRSPAMIDRIASFIIQEIIESHLQPFLRGEVLPRSRTPLDAVSDMVKQVLSEVIETHIPQNLNCGIYPKKFVGEIVARLLAKIFSPKLRNEVELENITRKIVNIVYTHFNKAKVNIPCDVRASYFPVNDTEIVDELAASVYRNVLQQHGFDPDMDTESENSDIFVENISKLIIKALSNYLLHPLFSGDLSTSSYSNSVAENIVYDILSNFSLSSKSSHSLLPYNTLLPYTFLEDMIEGLLSKFFPCVQNMGPNRESRKDKSGINYNEIASDLISDIRMKISQHEIRFSKDEDTKFIYSENEVQQLVDSVFKNVLQGSGSQESVEQSIEFSNDVFIDKIAGFIIKYICEQHLQPFLDRKSLSSSSYTCSDYERQQSFYASVYSSSFLEDVISGVLSKILHRLAGIVQMKPVKNSDDELLDKAEKLIYFIVEEFSKAQVTIIDNAEEQFCLPSVERDVVRNIIDRVYSSILEEHEVEIISDEDFLNNIKPLAVVITKVIQDEIIDYQIHPDLMENLPCKSYSKLSEDVLINRVKYDISKLRFRRQAPTIYTTMLSHMHLEKIVTQLVSQISPLASSSEQAHTSKADLNYAIMELINEIMSIISKHAICVTKHGNGKHSMISESDIQSMVDSIYADLSQSDLYRSLTRDRKGISSIPVAKVASFIIKEIFNHHVQSFLSGDKTLLSASVGQTYNRKETDTKKKELCIIVNSAVFLEEVISGVLCKILHLFVCNVLPVTNPEKVEDIATTLVKSIVLEFIASEILVADKLDKDLYFSEEYKDMVEKTVNSIYKKVLEEYKSMVKVYEVIQSDATCLGRKIYHFLLEEIYDYHVQSLVSGELKPSSYTSPRTDNIIRNVLSKILTDNSLPSCVTVFPRNLLEDMVDKLLEQIFSSNDRAKEVQCTPDDEFSRAALKLTEDIIKEIFEHEIRLSTAEESAESMQGGAIESFVDSICSNILKETEFQEEVKKESDKKEGSFLSKIAGFIMRGIMDHHLQPFLCEKEPSSTEIPRGDLPKAAKKPKKEKTQPSLFSATFLEDVIVDLVHKFCSFPALPESSKKKDMPETDIVGVAIKFANSLIGEFKKSEIKVLPKAEEIFSFPPIDKETIDTISNFVYDQFIGKVSSKDLQKDNGNIVIEMIAGLAKKAISAFKIQPLFSGDWTSTFFSFLNPDNIAQRVQLLPQNTFMQITKYVKGKQLPLPDHLNKGSSVILESKKKMRSLETISDAMCRRKMLNSNDTLDKKRDISDPILNSIEAIMKSNISNLPGSAPDVVKAKDGKKRERSIQKYSEHIPNTISATTSKKRQETPGHLSETEKAKSTPQSAQSQDDEIHQHYSVTTIDTECRDNIERSEFEIDIEKRIGNTSRSSMKLDGKTTDVYSSRKIIEPKTRNVGTTTEKTAKITEKANKKERRSFQGQTGMDEAPYADYGSVQNVIENIYDNVLHMSYPQEQFEITKPKYTKSYPGDKLSKDLSWSGSVITMDLPFSVNQEISHKEKGKQKEGNEKRREQEEVSEKEIQSNLNNKLDIQDRKPGVFPAKFLEDVIAELVNKLIFSSEPEAQISERYPEVNNDQHLYDLALKLINSLLKEFSDAQIKVFRPDKEQEIFSCAGKEHFVPVLPPKLTELIKDDSSFKREGKMPEMYILTPKSSSDTISLVDKVTKMDKTLVNKVVHSTLCSILKEHSSQESICENISYNRESLAQRLSSSVINEIFQHQLNLLVGDDIPVSACLPLESKEIVKKIQRVTQGVTQTASKECQTSSPYTILLPYKFLEDVISALLFKIFSKVPNTSTRAETPEENAYTELEFLQMKIVGTIAKQIANDEDMVIKYVEALHPNDDEIVQLVAQSIYNNLLPQFGSEEVIKNCITSGCRLLSDSIVDLVLREVAGNQLQNYFCGELTPHQCAEVDSVVDNILEDVIRTTPPLSPHVHKLSRNVIEEIAVKFLSKLFSVFPKGHKEKTKSPEMEMEKMTSKILNSFQEFICKSKIKLVQPDVDSPSVPLADNATIEKVVNSVYANVLKHSGSYSSLFKDLLGKGNDLSDIIGCLMVKEISNSEFQPQVEEEVSNSKLVLEAVKIMEKVVKIINELKSQEKSLSTKHCLLDGQILEEVLALFLAKLPLQPNTEIKNASILSKPELNKIATQLTKTISTEIARSKINLVNADPEEHFLSPHNMEMVTQVIDSVYSNILQQSGTLKELYDTGHGDTAFPKKVASLIIDETSKVQLDRVLSSNLPPFGELDINRIVEKAQKHTTNVNSDSDKEQSDEEVFRDPLPVKIVPHVREKPIKIDPNIVAQHLAVLSIKTQPIEQLQMDCLKRTGQSIAELRRASITGRNHSTSSTMEGRVKERRTSLDRTGRLDIKPCEAVCRNSFMNVKKPDITKIELLKDVRDKKELIIRLVAHDISQEASEMSRDDEMGSDEEELVLREFVAEEGLKRISEDQESQVLKPVESNIESPKPTISTKSLRKLLSLSNCCQSKTSVTIEKTEAFSNQAIDSDERNVKRAVGELDMASSKSLPEANLPREKKLHHKKEERIPVNEPPHFLIHRIMSSSSYNQDDLISSASETEDFNPEPSAKESEETSQEPMPEKSSSVKFTTLFDGSTDDINTEYPAKEINLESSKSIISIQGSKMLARVSSTLSKVFSRSNPSIPKSSSKPQDEH